MLVYFQKGFNYGQDGPGNRLVIHLQGCNMHCPWCSNPEGMEPDRNFGGGNGDRASGGGKMDRAPGGGNGDRASGGGKMDRAPGGGKLYRASVEELAEEIADCESLFFDGGGVTFTGGEATLQFEELRKLLAALKERGIHTAIETNGTHPRLPELFPLLDFLMMDLKQIDGVIHQSVTGVSNQRILENARKAAAEHPNVLFRMPLIHGFNTGAEDRKRFVDFAGELMAVSAGENVKFEFLYYHEYGKVKWEACGKPYRVKNGFVPDETRARFRQAFLENKIPLIQT